MRRFYLYPALGMDKGSALRQAKLDFIAKYKDRAMPLRWAGMIMVGDGSGSIFRRNRGRVAEGRTKSGL
jgi:CHAT domain-containing protein